MDLHVALLLVVIGLFVGFAKTAIGGFGLLAVTIAVTIIPARESTGVMLLLLLIGDLFAIKIYKDYVEWKFIRYLVAPVSIGLIFGAVFLLFSSDSSLKKFIGYIVVLLTILYLLSQLISKNLEHLSSSKSKFIGLLFGITAGFMSAVANAGGTPMSIYMLLRKKEKKIFLGNSAWFFFIVNLSKIPIVLVLNLLSLQSLKYLLPAVPFIPIGAFVGRRIIEKMNQKFFQNITIFFSFLLGISLIVI